MPEWTVVSGEVGLRLDKYLASPDRAGSRPKAAAALERGKVFVNDREMTLADAAARVAAGDVVRLWMDRPGSAKRRSSLGADRDLPVVYEDEAVIVLDKPAGLLAVPLPLQRRNDARSVFEDLKIYLSRRGRRRPFVVHRIDRDTSGLVLFAKSEAAQLTLKEQFKRHLPERVYQAIVYGHAVALVRHLARSPGLGSEGVDSEGDVAARSARQGSDQPLPRARGAGRRVVDRSQPGDGQAQPDPHPGAGCAATRWWERCAISTVRTPCGRSRFRARRCTRSV